MSISTRRQFVSGTAAAGVGLAAVASGIAATPLALAEEAAEGESESEDAAAEVELSGMALLSNGKEYEFYPPNSSGVAYEETPVTDDMVAETVECDVAVLGAGISGLTTALSAADAGLKVIVLEKNPFYNMRGSEIGCISGELR